MSYFKFYNHRGVAFTRDPQVARNPLGKGWVIQCHSEDTSLYGGQYVASVGFADVAGDGKGFIPFRLKRDAIKALAYGKCLRLFAD